MEPEHDLFENREIIFHPPPFSGSMFVFGGVYMLYITPTWMGFSPTIFCPFMLRGGISRPYNPHVSTSDQSPPLAKLAEKTGGWWAVALAIREEEICDSESRDFWSRTMLRFFFGTKFEVVRHEPLTVCVVERTSKIRETSWVSYNHDSWSKQLFVGLFLWRWN